MTIVCNSTHIESIDIHGFPSCLAYRNDALIRVSTGIGNAGKVPDYTVMIGVCNSHGSIRWCGISGTYSKCRRSCVNNVIDFVVDIYCLCQSISCEADIISILLLIQNKRRNKCGSSPG